MYSDSQVVVRQVTGQFEAKEEHLVKYLNLVKEVVGRFENYTIVRIKQSENVWAYALAKMASTSNGKNNVLIEYLEQPSVRNAKQVMEVIVLKEWMEPTHQYLKDGVLPPDSKQARKLKCKTVEYTLLGEILYKRSCS